MEMDHMIAAKLETVLEKGELPSLSDWEKTQPASFASDWRGEQADPRRETEVRMLWSRDFLFIRFRCRFREIYVYEGGNTRRDQLWLRDVAEAFIRPDTNDLRHYKEFEISPNGDWLDLDICSGKKTHLLCDLNSRVILHSHTNLWTAELAVPFSCMTDAFNPSQIWRLNLFRIEGAEPNRFYSAWRPTHTPQPNFHVPEQFGELQFA
jgi:hypothetical protein